MKRSTRRIAWVAAVLLALVIGGGIALKMVLTPERLRTEIERRTADATGLAVDVGGAHLTLVPFGIRIREVRLGPEAEPFVQLRDGLVRLELGPLLSRQVVVSRITLDAPRVSLVRGPDGIVLPGKLGSQEPGRPAGGGGVSAAGAGAGAFAATVERIEIRDGRLEIRTLDGAADVSLEGIGLTAGLEIEEGGRILRSAGELSLAGLSLAALDAWRETLDQLEPVVAFDLELQTAESRLELRELRLRADPLDVAGTGVLEGFPEALRIRLEVAPSTYELSELLPLIPSALIPEGRTLTASGPARISAIVDGLLGAEVPPAWSADIGFEGADIAMEGFPVGIRGIRGAVRATAADLEFDGVSVTLGEDPLEVTGRIDAMDTESPRIDLTVRGDLDLALLAEGGFVPPDVTLGGRANLDVRAVGRADAPQDANLEGTVHLANGRIATATLPAPVTGLTLDARLAGADVELDSVRGSLGRSSFDGHGSIANALGAPEVTLEGHCAVLDLLELAPPAPEAGAKAGAPDAAGAPAASLPPLVPPLPPFPTQVKLVVDSLITAGMTLTAVDVEADLRSDAGQLVAQIGRAEMETISLEGFDTRVDLDGASARGDFRAPIVQAHVVPLTGVTGRFDLGADRVLRVADVRGSAWTGQVAGEATVDLSDPANPAFTIESNATGIQANDFLSALTPARGLLFGSLDIRSSFSGTGATAEDIVAALTGEGAVTTANGRIENTPAIRKTWAMLGLNDRESIPFNDLVAPFSLREGRVHTENLAIGGGDADWLVNGSAGLDGQLDYSITAELSEAVSEEVRRRAGRDLANLLAGSSGRLIVDFRIRGDATQPKVELDRKKLAQRMAENAKENLKDELGDAIRGLFK